MFQLNFIRFTINGFPDSSVGNAGDPGSVPGLGRSPGERKGHPLQYSGLENSMDSIVHGVPKSWTWLRDFFFTSLHKWLKNFFGFIHKCTQTFPWCFIISYLIFTVEMLLNSLWLFHWAEFFWVMFIDFKSCWFFYTYLFINIFSLWF